MMPQFLAEVDFEVFCGTCGAGLCNSSDSGENSRGHYVTVDVCEDCKQVAYDQGYEEARAEFEVENE